MESQNLELNGNIVTKPSSVATGLNAYATWASVTKFEIRVMETEKHYRIGLTSDASDGYGFANGCFVALHSNGRFGYGGSYEMGDIVGVAVDGNDIVAYKNNGVQISGVYLRCAGRPSVEGLFAKLWFYEAPLSTEIVSVV